jgi:hypothetical protein
MNRIALATSCLIFCALLCLGCGSDDDDNDNPNQPGNGHPPAALVGSWIFQSVTVDGTPTALSVVLDWVAGAVEARFSIQADADYVYEELNASGGQVWFEMGSIFVDGNDVDINIQSDSDGPIQETSSGIFTLDQDELTLALDEEGSAVVFTLTRMP